MIKHWMVFLLIGLLALACQPSGNKQQPTQAPIQKEHFPYNPKALNEIKSILDRLPQIKNLGYVFKDFEFLNEQLIVFDKQINLGESIIVNRIDFRSRRYEDEEVLPKYYKDELERLKIAEQDFDQLYKLMKDNYIEGLINMESRIYLFLNKPMGIFKGFLYAKDGRKGVGQGFELDHIQFRVLESFENKWFGFVYP